VVFPEMDQFRRATQLVSAKARIEGKAGRPEAAMHWLAVGVRMSQQAASEPTLIAQLVSYSMLATLGLVDRTAVCETTAPGPQTGELEKALVARDLGADFQRCAQGERVMGLAVFDFLRNQPVGEIMSPGNDEVGPIGATAGFLVSYATPLGAPLSRYDELLFLRRWDEQVRAMVRPYRDSQADFDALDKSLREAPWFAVATLLEFPTYRRATQKRDWAEAETTLWRLALGLRMYKSQHGRYPESLSRLQGTLDWAIPPDPFSGKAFVYRTEGEGFVVYSLGPDMEDGGARLQLGDDKGNREKGDIVWRCER
jgi:hypothetical protein